MKFEGASGHVIGNMNHGRVSEQLVSGALSGLASTLALQPCTCIARSFNKYSHTLVDFLKTRVQQSDPAHKNVSSTSRILTTARTVVKSDGILGLWRGTAATLARNVPGNCGAKYSGELRFSALYQDRV